MKWFSVFMPLAIMFGFEQSPSTEEHSDELIGKNIPSLKDVAYVEKGTARQTLDLSLPLGNERKPLVIWIHGGAFTGGSKAPPLPALRMLPKDSRCLSTTIQ